VQENNQIENQDHNCHDCLKTSECFRQLYADELSFLSDKKTQIAYLKGETIVKQGAFAPYILYVIDGLVRVYLQAGKSKQLNLRLAVKGDFLAFSTIFGDNVYNYSAVALKDSTVCMIDKNAMRQLLMKNPDFAFQIVGRNCRNDNRYLNIIQNLSYKQMRGKLASALLYLSSDEFKEEGVFEHLNRQDIADFASVTVESAIKFLKEFEKDKLIRFEGKNIEIINRSDLDVLSRNG